MKPNLFIIGEPKTGTTVLNHYLNKHPECFMSQNPRATHFFAKDHIEEAYSKNPKEAKIRFIVDEDEYLRLFEGKETEYAGEASTDYAMSEMAAKALYEFNPNARIIYGVREPTRLLESLFDQRKNRRQDEEAKSLKEALQLEESRKKHPEESSLVAQSLYYSDRVEYKKNIKKFTRYFPSDQIFVYVYEDFKQDNQRVLNQIWDFLDIEDFEVERAELNTRSQVKYHWLRKYFIHSYRIRAVCRKVLPLRLRKVWGYLIDTITLEKSNSKNRLNPDYRKELQQRFKPKVRALNQFLHSKNLYSENLLEKWGYDQL